MLLDLLVKNVFIRKKLGRRRPKKSFIHLVRLNYLENDWWWKLNKIRMEGFLKDSLSEYHNNHFISLVKGQPFEWNICKINAS